MSANLLLRWMSARERGSWAQFRGAVEELHFEDGGGGEDGEEGAIDGEGFPLYQELRLNLQRLGHAEFFSGGDSDWRVAPPVIADSGEGASGVLTGARSEMLFRHLTNSVELESLESIPMMGAPDAVRVRARSPDGLMAIARTAGIAYQRQAPAGILLSLPRVDDLAVRRETELPFGDEWRVDRFSGQTLSWIPASISDANRARAGLFRFVLRYRREFFFSTRGKHFRIPSQVGKYLVLSNRRRRIISYDAIRRRLSVPAICRPPFLVERALALSSGLLPSYESESRTIHYDQVPQLLADLAIGLLRQEAL